MTRKPAKEENLYMYMSSRVHDSKAYQSKDPLQTSREQ